MIFFSKELIQLKKLMYTIDSRVFYGTKIERIRICSDIYSYRVHIILCKDRLTKFEVFHSGCIDAAIDLLLQHHK